MLPGLKDKVKDSLSKVKSLFGQVSLDGIGDLNQMTPLLMGSIRKINASGFRNSSVFVQIKPKKPPRYIRWPEEVPVFGGNGFSIEDVISVPLSAPFGKMQLGEEVASIELSVLPSERKIWGPVTDPKQCAASDEAE